MTTPGHEPSSTPPPPSGHGAQPPYGTQGTPYGQPQPSAPYGAPAYGAPSAPGAQPYGAPGGQGQPFGAPGSQHGASGQPYAAPTQPYGAPGWQQPAPRMRKTLAAKIFTFLGIALGIGSIAMGVSGVASIQGALPADPAEWSESLTSIESPGTGTLAATAGTTYEFLTSGTASSSDYEYVYVAGPSGAEVEIRAVSASSLSSNGIDVSRFAQFTATETGTHTIEVGEGFDGVVIMKGGTFDNLFGDFATGAGLILGAVVVGGLGFVLLLIGAIWWGVAAANNRKVRAQGDGGPQGGTAIHPGR